MAITVQGPTGVFQPSYPDIIDKYGVVTKMFTSSFKEYFTSNGSGGATDTYWPFVSMLLHGDGTNAAQNNTFLDTSTNNFTVTRNGNTTQGSFNPFVPTYPYAVATNGGSAYFDGTGDYLSIPSTTAFTVPASGSFTIEAWVNLSSLGADRVVFSSGVSGGLNDLYFGVSSSNTIGFIAPSTSGATGYYAYGTTALAANTWYHIAVTRVGGTVRLFLNGTQETITQYQPSNSANQFGATGPAYIGTYFNTFSWFAGYISNLRFVNGTALYTASFTPPTAPLTAVTNTALLLGFTNGAIYDNTMLNNLETVANAQISTSVFKYGTGALKFNGTTDYLKTSPANQNSFAFGSGDFTIEMWVYTTSVAGFSTIYDSYPTSTNGAYPSIQLALGQLVYVINLTTVISGGTLAINTWYHVAVTRSGTSTKMFLNGTQTGSTFAGDTNVYLNTSLRPYIGLNGYNGAGFFPGYIDDLRVTKGIARYTTTFTPPTAAFPNLGPTYPSGTATQRAIFGYGSTGSVTAVTNIVSNTGVVAGDTTGVGTARNGLAAAGYGGDKAIFGYGVTSVVVSMTNLVSNAGAVATDTTGVGTARYGLAAAGYSTDKAIFGYGAVGASPQTVTNLVSNTGVVAADTTGVGTARVYLAAAKYGTDKGIFVCGSTSVTVNAGVSLTNLVSNTGVVATDTAGVGTAREQLAAAGYGGDKAIYAYGYIPAGSSVSISNLVSNTGVVAADVTGVGTARRGTSASNYGSDKALFGYGFVDPSTYLSLTNLVSNTGVVATDTTGVGTARYFPAAAGFSYS